MHGAQRWCWALAPCAGLTSGGPTSFVRALYAAIGPFPINNKRDVARYKWRRLPYEDVESELIRGNVFDVL
jgi:hypothetical protein